MSRRVLVVTNDFPPRAGGIETYVDQLLSHLDPTELVVHACSQEGDRRHDAQLSYPVVRDPDRLLLPGPGLASRVRDTARRHGASAVWFPSSVPLGLLAPACRAAGVRTVVASSHGHEVWWARLPGSRGLLRRVGASVDVVTFDSAVVRRPIAQALSPRAAAAMVRLAPGVDVDRFDRAWRPASHPRSGRGPGDGPVVLCLSRAVRRKGHARLLRAWPELLRRHPTARLLLAGDGPELSRLHGRAAGTASVDVLGAVPPHDLPRLYASADLFVLPVADGRGGLETESLGMVLLEAAAAGLPVVAGRSGGTVEAVLPGRTGLLVDATDPDELLCAVDRMLADEDGRRRMGREGRAWVRGSWGWQQTAQRLSRLLAGETVPRW